MDMLVVTGTKPGQLACNAWAVSHEAGGFEHRTNLAPHAPNPTDHAELTHMCLHPQHVVALWKSRNFAEGPTGREPGVLVQEETAMSALMFIDLGTTSHMALRLFHSELELL